MSVKIGLSTNVNMKSVGVLVAGLANSNVKLNRWPAQLQLSGAFGVSIEMLDPGLLRFLSGCLKI